MERILVAVDEDPMREHVVRKADEIAGALRASMLICHVLSHDEYERVKSQLSYSEAAERASIVGQEAVDTVGNLNAHYKLQGAIGEPPEELLRLADELDAGMIGHGLCRPARPGAPARARQRLARSHGVDDTAGVDRARAGLTSKSPLALSVASSKLE